MGFFAMDFESEKGTGVVYRLKLRSFYEKILELTDLEVK